MAAQDLFEVPGGRSDLRNIGSQGITAPASILLAVTPHDTNELTYVTRGLYVGGAGNIVVVAMDGTQVTFTAVPAGTLLPIRVKQVKSSSTTATAIIALI